MNATEFYQKLHREVGDIIYSEPDNLRKQRRINAMLLQILDPIMREIARTQEAVVVADKKIEFLLDTIIKAGE